LHECTSPNESVNAYYLDTKKTIVLFPNRKLHRKPETLLFSLQQEGWADNKLSFFGASEIGELST